MRANSSAPHEQVLVFTPSLPGLQAPLLFSPPQLHPTPDLLLPTSTLLPEPSPIAQMHDCRLNGGHFFVLRPMSTFTCYRCRRVFSSRDPLSRPTTRSSAYYSSKTPLSSVTPWHCILESCNILSCVTCVDHVQTELCALQIRINEAKARGEHIDTDAAIREIEKAPHNIRRPGTRDGAVDGSSGRSRPGTSGNMNASKIPEPVVVLKPRVGPCVKEPAQESGSYGLDPDMKIEAEGSDAEEDDDDDDDDDDMPVIPFRTAAMAAASARMRMRSNGPRIGNAMGWREGKAVM